MVEFKKVKINGKYTIVLPSHRADRPEWFTPEGWEKVRLDMMHEVIRKGDVVYYVGAEEGDMAALCQLWGAEVVLFEPNRKVVPNIKAIWLANDLEYPLYYAGFAGAKSSKDYLEGIERIEDIIGDVISDHGFKELHEPFDEKGEIPQIALDDYYNLRGIKPPTVISIDVEGSEWEVLKGAETILKRYKPKLFLSVHPEFMFRIYGAYQYDLRNWVRDIGYTETILDYQHELHVYYEPK